MGRLTAVKGQLVARSLLLCKSRESNSVTRFTREVLFPQEPSISWCWGSNKLGALGMRGKSMLQTQVILDKLFQIRIGISLQWPTTWASA